MIYGVDDGNRYYAVARGRNPGVYWSWEDCHREVSGFNGAVYEVFETLEDARTFLDIQSKQTTGPLSQAKSSCSVSNKLPLSSDCVYKKSIKQEQQVGQPNIIASNQQFTSPLPISNPYSTCRNVSTESVALRNRLISQSPNFSSELTPVPGKMKRDNKEISPLRSSIDSSNLIQNPYKRPRKEVKAPTCHQKPLITPVANSQNENLRPAIKDTFDLFFVAFLRSSVEEYVRAAHSEDESQFLWESVCNRLNIPIPNGSIRPVYDDAKEHFDIRAALVLEETRDSISRSLSSCWKQISDNQTYSVISMTASLSVELISMKERNHGMNVLTFQSHPEEKNSKRPAYFSESQKSFLRQGFIFQCRPTYGNDDISNAFLGCVLPCSGERINKNSNFDILACEKITDANEGSSWILTPVDNFLTSYRQFVALSDYAHKVPFLNALMGKSKDSTDPRPTGEVRTQVLNTKCSTKPNGQTSIPSRKAEHPSRAERCKNHEIDFTSMKLPSLNENQEKAIQSFLDSAPESITIVQGPPGTGKTTLLVSTVCKWLVQQHSLSSEISPRLVVCAPTNKAISVLATRLVKALEGSGLNIILIGDGEKLVGKPGKKCILRPYFIYSWKAEVEKELDHIIEKIISVHNTSAVQEIQDRVSNIVRTILCRLRKLPNEFKEELIKLSTGITSDNTDWNRTNRILSEVRKRFVAIDPEAIRMDILESSHIILCTLCTSGSPTLLKNGMVASDLIIDEAAAATEADIAIPFHFKPSRLLVVGDPKQLPATVISNKAKRAGFDISLHERLMKYCGASFTMLKVQYRMHPSISSFPAAQFYAGNLLDGTNVLHSNYQTGKTVLGGRPYVLLQVSSKEENLFGGSYCNPLEADTIVDLVSDFPDRSNHDRLRIITFYSGQVSLIKKRLASAKMGNVLVSTVDSAQGCEADVVIVSFVRSDSAGFISDDRRLNVALTRAKFQLICVGNVHQFHLFKNAKVINQLGNNALKRKVITLARNTKQVVLPPSVDSGGKSEVKSEGRFYW